MRLFNLVFSTFVLFTSASALATLTISSIGGVSSYTISTSTTTVNAIYGGRAISSSVTTCTQDGLNTCNSCTGEGSNKLSPCNPNSVYPTLKVRLTLVSSTSFGAGATADVKNTTSNTTVTSTATVSGSSVVVDILWSDLCSSFISSGSGTCSAGAFKGTMTVNTYAPGSSTATDTLTFTVYYSAIDANSTSYYTECNSTQPGTYAGYCYARFERGDEKVYLDQLYIDTGYPTSPFSSIKYSGLVFMYEQQTAADAGNDATTIARISNNSNRTIIAVNNVSDPATISDNRVTGLTNEERFCFVMANQDQTGNIFNFTPVSSYSATSNNSLCATPSKVVGLLDDKHCFIATAAFDSDMAPEVETFRQFRNHFMAKNFIGRSIVKTYYKLSPPLAQFISENEFLKASVRAALWPILMFAKLSLEIGLMASLCLLLITLFVARELYRKIYAQFHRGVVS